MAKRKSAKAGGPASWLMYRRHKYALGPSAALGNDADIQGLSVAESDALSATIRRVLDAQSNENPAVMDEIGSADVHDEFAVPTVPVQVAMSRLDPAMRGAGGAVPVGGLSQPGLEGDGMDELAEQSAQSDVHQSQPGFLSRMFRKAWAVLPKRFLLGAGAVVALVMWQPLVIPAALIFVLTLVALLYFSLGPVRMASMAKRWWIWLDRRNPQKAELWRGRAEYASQRLEAIVHVLPGRWTNELHIPEMPQPRHGMPPKEDRVEQYAKLRSVKVETKR